MLLYSCGNWFYRKKIPLVPVIFNVLIRIIHNSAVSSETQIGKGTIFGYGGIAVVVHKKVIIGKCCVIGSNVTIGGRSKSKRLPVLEDNVYVATGAKILGDVRIGSGSIIGANAVVINDVPPRSIVVGIPAKVIKSNIDYRDFI